MVGGTREEMHATLSAAARGEWHAGVVRSKVEPGGGPGAVFVFPGQGSQWAGMGRTLLAEEPVFRRVMEECDALMRPHAGFSVIEKILAPEAASQLGETAVAQPALFAMEVAIAALLASWGVRPDAVIGHSVGEVAAAHVAGALGLEEAVRLVCCRGRVMQRATGLGKMAVVEMAPGAAAEMLSRYEGRLAIGAVNDPGSVVLSGEIALSRRRSPGSRRGDPLPGDTGRLCISQSANGSPARGVRCARWARSPCNRRPWRCTAR